MAPELEVSLSTSSRNYFWLSSPQWRGCCSGSGMANVRFLIARSSLSFILDVSKPYRKASLKPRRWGWALAEARMNFSSLALQLSTRAQAWKGCGTVAICHESVTSLEGNVASGPGGTGTEVPRWLSRGKAPRVTVFHSIWAGAGSEVFLKGGLPATQGRAW